MPLDDPLVLLAAADDRATLLDSLRRLGSIRAADLAAALAARETPTGRERLAIVASPATMHASIELALARLPALTRPRWVARAQGISFTKDFAGGRTAFLFPGQGSQYVGMLRQYRERVPIVRDWFDALDAAAVALGQPALTPLLDPDGTEVQLDERRTRTA